MITEIQLQAALEAALKTQKDEIVKVFTKEFNSFKKELKSLSTKIDKIECIADDALQHSNVNNGMIIKLQTDIEDLTTRVNSLKKENGMLNVSSTASEITIKSLETKVEDSVNRHLRKTLVVKGIKESPRETWTMTEQLLASTISEASDGKVTDEEAARMIERAHRSAPNREKKGRRDIYVKLYDWKDAEYIKKIFTHINIKDKQFRIYCEQKYGPLTTAR